MKKLLLLLCFAALCAGFAGCNEPNVSPSDDSEVPEEIGILPVSASDISEEVSAFFDDNLPISSYSRPPHEFNFGNVDFDETICLMINSEGEFEGIAPPSVELPEIDFAQYTLVIGQHPMGYPGFRLRAQGIDTESDEMILNLVYERFEGGGYPAIEVMYYYWGLYPKLPQKPIDIDIIIYN